MISVRSMAFTKGGPDRADILQIEKQSYRRPWTPAKFDAVLSSPHVGGVVAEQHQESGGALFLPSLVTGYLIYKVYPTSIHIISMATLCDSRRMGIGVCLVNYIKDEAVDTGRDTIVVRTGDMNLPAQLFFKKCGFTMCKTLSSSAFDKDMKQLVDHKSYRLKCAV